MDRRDRPSRVRRILAKLHSAKARSDSRYRVARFLNPAARRLGFTVVADHFCQPIPSPRALSQGSDRPRIVNGIEWRLDDQCRFVASLLAGHHDEFDAAVLGEFGYPLDSTSMGPGDAEVLFSLIREVRPARVIEIGAGHSTLLIGAALAANCRESGSRAEFVSIEPFPSAILGTTGARLSRHVDFSMIREPVQRVATGLFTNLGHRDILFVDSTHVFKHGSDVETEFQQIYPALAGGVLVHIHDIFFPFDYPLEWNLKHSFYWNEQYFLETFLQFNTRFDVVASLSMVAHHRERVFLEAIPRYRPGLRPASFWMRAGP